MQTQTQKRARGTASALLLMAVAAGPVYAQGIEEVVVTARKREESLQSIPVSVTAFSMQQIERIGIQDLTDVSQFTPGLTFQSISGTLALPVIRGLAQTNIVGAENNVSSFLNGIYLSNNRALDVDLLDLERIEVIKGPQSALYGRNSFAGAISYVTARPTEEFEAYVQGSVGGDELWETKISASGPIVPGRLAGRLSAMVNNFDGTFENEVSSDNLQGWDGFGIYGMLEAKISDKLNADVFVYHADQDNEHPAQAFIPSNCGVSAFNTPTNLCGTIDAPDTFSISPDAFGLKSKNTIVGLTLNWQLSDQWGITSVTGYARSESSSLLDNDGSGVGVPYFTNLGPAISNAYLGQGETLVKDWSQELRLVFTGDRASGSIGGYYYTSDRSNSSLGGIDTRPFAPGQALLGFAAPFGVDDPVNNPVGPINLNEDEVDTIAVFAEGSYRFTDALELSAEVRYTDEDKKTDRILNFLFPGIGPDEANFSFVTFRFIGNYQLTDSAMLYASIASGARSGGFNANATAAAPNEASYDEEKNLTYEIGAKTQWFDNRLTANLSLFWVDWSDLQINSRSADPNNIFSVVRNSGDATSKGLELELSARITDYLSAGFGYAYNEPTFDEGAVDLGLTTLCGVDTSICSFNANGEPDVGGNQLGRTSKHQLNFNVEVAAPLVGSWSWYARTDVAWQSRQPVRSANVSFQDDYAIANVRAGVLNERFELSVWARNVFDENYLTAVSLQPRFHTGGITDTTHGNLRMWGITGRINF